MSRSLRIAIASGKGGTGITTVATCLAAALTKKEGHLAYLDCDVEEANGHIFLESKLEKHCDVVIPTPEVNTERCILCGACAAACRYSATVLLTEKVLILPKLCHGCGGCTLACRQHAITENPRAIGAVEKGQAGTIAFFRGQLNTGEVSALPVVRALLDAAPTDATVVIDAPPGTSSAAVEAVKGADVIALVAEPTPFGLNDLKLAAGMSHQLRIPFGVIINRTRGDGSSIVDYCTRYQIPMLLEIPDDLEIARAYSRGGLATSASPSLERELLQMHESLVALARKGHPAQSQKRPATLILDSAQDDSLVSEVVRLDAKRDLRELVVISGKGGTGKTSIVASLFALANQATVVDCDVDAADLHLVLAPTVLRQGEFSGGEQAVIDPTRCVRCGLCALHCRFDAIRPNGGGYYVEPLACEGCGVCVDTCPAHAVDSVTRVNGKWFVSDTRHGPMVHACLGVAQGNSGKLVWLVRREARAVADANGSNLLICDGSPGIGSPLIASLAGAHMVLVVTEPTLSGQHDLGRVADLCEQLNVPVSVCINKADINLELADEIEADAESRQLPMLGRIRDDETVAGAQVKQISVVENGGGAAAHDILALWQRVSDMIA